MARLESKRCAAVSRRFIAPVRDERFGQSAGQSIRQQV
jgi:hypothetical protein